MAEMLRKANIRTRERDSTHSRMPSKLPAPVLPPSTHVVTPVERAMSSVRGPKSAAPAKQCACRSMSPGSTSRPLTSSTVSPSGASPARTSVTRPSRTRTSSAPPSPAPGSMTCPPRSSTPITRLRPRRKRSRKIGRRELTRRRAPEPRLAAARGTLRPGARGALSVLRRPARHRQESVDPSARAPRGRRRATHSPAPVGSRAPGVRDQRRGPTLSPGVRRHSRCHPHRGRPLGMADAPDDAAYDPAIYRAVYERLLAHRHAQALAVDERLPAAGTSAYDFRIPTTDLVPSDVDVARFIAEAEHDYADAAALRREIAGWFNP